MSEPSEQPADETPKVELLSDPSPESPRDAGAIDQSALPYRATGMIHGQRLAKFQAVVDEAVMEEIHLHGLGSPEAEICGVLVGAVQRDSQGPYVHISGSIRGDAAESRNAQVTFKAETWTHIQQVMERDHPHASIVGWYHTHPGFGIFLSGMDLFIQDHFFNLPWQVALVYDPRSGESGVFVWRNGKSEREEFLIEDQGHASRRRNEEIGAPPVPGESLGSADRQTWLLAALLFVISLGITYLTMGLLRST